MICPSCESEFREGFTHCRSCDVDLVEPSKTPGIRLAVKAGFGSTPTKSAPHIIFPTEFCCNCGLRDTSVAVKSQNTRLTRYFGFFGAEYTADFALPFCANCAATAKRRPSGMLHRTIAAALITAIVFFGLVFYGIEKNDQPLLERSIWIALVSGVVVTTLWYLTRRPRGEQTSFYQPVTIQGIERGPGTSVNELALGFTNERYLHAFVAGNFDVVSAGRVVVEHVS
ncbi:MAG TPA: hypothetical protein VFN10_12660 [Thermoanaerobaculia bacterium]|nr:hypothetical protein [Thermoanaerobaculia bacterium]